MDYKIILVDDDKDHLELAQLAIKKRFKLDSICYENPSLCLDTVNTNNRILIMDTNIGYFNGPDFFEEHKNQLKLPVIGTSNCESSESLWKKAGAEGFIGKKDLFTGYSPERNQQLLKVLEDAVLRYNFFRS